VFGLEEEGDPALEDLRKKGISALGGGRT